ncbi:hypothetical protein [Agromyces bauzanensis]
MTVRDEAMIEWLSVVRMVDMEGIRYALGGFSGEGEPVSLRRAQQWVARLKGTGLVDSARPTFRDGSIVWATHAATGKAAPHLFRQTTRHEVAVASISARYICHGWTWQRDREPASKLDHMTDGVAVRGDEIELVEVELTPKVLGRYVQIFNNHTSRLEREGVGRVVYFCDAATERAVRRIADQRVHHTGRHKVLTLAAFDVRGKWIGDDSRMWLDGSPVDPTATSVPAELDGLNEGMSR